MSRVKEFKLTTAGLFSNENFSYSKRCLCQLLHGADSILARTRSTSQKVRNSRILNAVFGLMLIIGCLANNTTVYAHTYDKEVLTGSSKGSSMNNTLADIGRTVAIEYTSEISKNNNSSATIVELEIPQYASRIDLNIQDSQSHEKFICQKGNVFWISPFHCHKLKFSTVRNLDVARAESVFLSSRLYAYPIDLRFIDSTVNNNRACNYSTALQELNYLHSEDILPIPPLKFWKSDSNS